MKMECEMCVTGMIVLQLWHSLKEKQISDKKNISAKQNKTVYIFSPTFLKLFELLTINAKMQAK